MLEQIEEELTKMSYEELCELHRAVKIARLKKRPRFVALIAVKSSISNQVHVLEKVITNPTRALAGFRKRINTDYLGYRLHKFDGSQWSLVEEAGDTSRFTEMDIKKSWRGK